MSKTSKKLIRTDKWSLNPSFEQKFLFEQTVREYRLLCRYLSGVVLTHWDSLGSLSVKDAVPAIERRIHPTHKNPEITYPQIHQRFYKFPSYYRRAAIAFALGQVSSFMTRYREWVSGNSRNRRDAKPPTFNPEAGCYPALYKGQCYRLDSFDSVDIKVFDRKEWRWTSVQITGLGHRHLVESNKMLSPSLIYRKGKTHLSVPLHCKPETPEKAENVTSVDLGINTTATVSVVNFDGTVIHREFIHPGRDIDRRDKRLKSISRRAKKTANLSKGFCSHTYRKCRNINRQISHTVSKQIVAIAMEFSSSAIVFENLKGWKPKGGKKKSNLKQRFHGWMKSAIHDLTVDKWAELKGKTLDVPARGTSSNAYDGSGEVKRNKDNHALATFPSGKQYNADLSASYNIGARGIIKLTGRNDREGRTGKSSRRPPRSWGLLWDLWQSMPKS